MSRGFSKSSTLRRAAVICAIFALAPTALSASPAPAPAPVSPLGTWLTEKGDARIRITTCGRNLCGTIVWLRDPIDPATGKRQVDDKNPDPAQHARPIIGLQIFKAMAPTGPLSWSGEIYNADDGKTYASSVRPLDAAHLEVKGCVGPFCGSETWTRQQPERK